MERITKFVNSRDVNKKWYLIDAKGQAVGRVAVEAAKILRGKNKPTFTSNINMGDNVIVINAAKVKVTGRKLANKLYYRHATNYVGNLKRFTLGNILGDKPQFTIEHAVRLMLPKNKLGRKMLKGLRVYRDDKYPQEIKVTKAEEAIKAPEVKETEEVKEASKTVKAEEAIKASKVKEAPKTVKVKKTVKAPKMEEAAKTKETKKVGKAKEVKKVAKVKETTKTVKTKKIEKAKEVKKVKLNKEE
ncbi:MAG: 50S ribosomal protein L13 [Caldisericota bacterium]|nr:50S ribosomal protein L13 [Caldisericota bacterium]